MGQLLVQGTVCSEPQPKVLHTSGVAEGQMPSDLGGELGLRLVGCCGLGGKLGFESLRLLDSLAREGDQYKPHHWVI